MAIEDDMRKVRNELISLQVTLKALIAWLKRGPLSEDAKKRLQEIEQEIHW